MTPRHALLLLLALAATSRPAAAEEKTLGLVTLKSQGVDRSSERAANAQLRVTLSAIKGLAVVDQKLPAGKAATDLGALKSALTSGALDRIVGGEITFEGETGRLRLVSVGVAGKPLSVSRELPNQRQEELLSAVESAACEVVGDDSRADGCQGSLVLEGSVDKAELLIDGTVRAQAPFLAETPIPLGPHMVQLRQGQLLSQERRFYVHYGAAVKLRASASCGRLFILDVGEKEICDDSLLLSAAIASTLLVEPPAPPKWPAILTTIAGGALLLGGTIFGLQANTRAGDINAAYQGGGLRPDDAAKLAEMESNAALATGLLAGGGVVTALGCGLFFVEF
jgi:hypothetical protein